MTTGRLKEGDEIKLRPKYAVLYDVFWSRSGTRAYVRSVHDNGKRIGVGAFGNSSVGAWPAHEWRLVKRAKKRR